MSDRPITAREKARAARQEAKHRLRAYDKLVADGRISKPAARRQIAIMIAIAHDYDRQAIADEREERLQ